MARIKPTGNFSKQELILAKAALLFRKSGYTATSMRALAEELGIEAPSLYNHFSSKNEILQKICFNTADIFNNNINREIISKENCSLILENLIRFHVRKMLKDFDFVYVSDHEWRHLPSQLVTDYLNQRKIYEDKMVKIVEKGIAKGEFKKIYPYSAVLTILSAVRGLETWQKRKRRIFETDLENDIVNHLLYGLKK